jgi:glucan phosphorylase
MRFYGQNETVHARISRLHGQSSCQNGSRKSAYFCMEYGLHQSVRLYSGGLGVLAGDYLKEVSDRNFNLIAVGLLYRYGYFQQGISLHGEQIHHLEACQIYPTAPAARARRTRRMDQNTRQPGGAHGMGQSLGVATWAACRFTCSIPISTTTAGKTAPSPTNCTAATTKTACGRKSCSASAACARSKPCT